MTKLGDLYIDFSRIDLDTRGGFARVAQVKTLGQKDYPAYCAFKLMRHDLESPEKGVDRFEGEIRTLIEITRDKHHPEAITKIYDSGFTTVDLSNGLQKPLEVAENTRRIEPTNPNLEIISVGPDLMKFMSLRSELMTDVPDRWLPYIVVELAPYDDNLLRQIRALSLGSSPDLYRLTVREIISMGLQILDLIIYLHQNYNFAYMDWKPEHIYWNSLKPQLKIIDWNVTDHFKNQRDKKRLIREDIRMFCGAALYCSLALNDPEDPNWKRPIGPKNPLFSSERRYWTYQPDFYERDAILDKRIKQLIQRALDPQKGFDTPQDLKNELLNYAEQTLSLSATDLSPNAMFLQRSIEIDLLLDEADDALTMSEYHRSIQLYDRALRIDPNNDRARTHLIQAKSELSKLDDTGSKIPGEARQLFRRARSYISTKDYQEAIRMLEDAIEIAFKKQIIFQEAQELLSSVQTSFQIEKIQEDIADALKEENWENVLELYGAAINLDPTNRIIRNEFEILSDLLREYANEHLSKSDWLFTNLRPLQYLVSSAREFLEPSNLLINTIEKQITRIKLTRLGSGVVILLICIFFYPYLSHGFLGFFNPTGNSTLVAAATTTINTKTAMPVPPTPIVPSATPSPTPANTLTPTPELVTLGNGYNALGQISAWDKPNGKFVDNLVLYQVVIILEKTNDHGDNWYRCTWISNGVTKEGWILAKYIEIGIPPTPKP